MYSSHSTEHCHIRNLHGIVYTHTHMCTHTHTHMHAHTHAHAHTYNMSRWQ